MGHVLVGKQLVRVNCRFVELARLALVLISINTERLLHVYLNRIICSKVPAADLILVVGRENYLVHEFGILRLVDSRQNAHVRGESTLLLCQSDRRRRLTAVHYLEIFQFYMRIVGVSDGIELVANYRYAIV